MKLKIEEKSDTSEFRRMPLCYRVSINVYHGEIVLCREYFRAGFTDGESYDKFYTDNEMSWKRGSSMSRCTFITKNIDDKKYLKRKENELIKIFLEKCGDNIEMLKKQLIEETKRKNRDINNYNDILNHFEYLKRGDKLRKIKDKL